MFSLIRNVFHNPTPHTVIPHSEVRLAEIHGSGSNKVPNVREVADAVTDRLTKAVMENKSDREVLDEYQSAINEFRNKSFNITADDANRGNDHSFPSESEIREFVRDAMRQAHPKQLEIANRSYAEATAWSVPSGLAIAESATHFAIWRKWDIPEEYANATNLRNGKVFAATSAIGAPFYGIYSLGKTFQSFTKGVTANLASRQYARLANALESPDSLESV